MAGQPIVVPVQPGNYPVHGANKMKNVLVTISLLGAVTSTTLACADPVKMTDEQLTDVTAGGPPALPLLRLVNSAVALNNVSTTGGSASVTCVVGCVAINIAVLSGNIVGPISQV